MAVVIKLRKGTSAQWSTSTLILATGEVGLETDTSRMKIGNGSSLWSALPYANVLPSELAELAQDAVGNTISVGSGLTKTYDDANNVINLGINTDYVATVSALTSHEMDTTGIHGIADTSALATKTYADTAASNAQSNAASALSLHEADTTNIHGIADTSELATKTYTNNAVSTAVSNLLNSAPAALDTLKELADALGNDSNYASTITTALAQKASLTGTETLTNKTISGGTISGTVYTDAATLWFTGSPMTLTGAINGTDLVINDATLNNTEFTGQVSGIAKDMVGLSDVDNTSDLNKPVSVLTQAAISALESSVNTSLGTKADKKSNKTEIGTTAYTLTMADMYTRIEFTQSTPITITIPNDSTENMPIGTNVELLQAGTGKLTVTNADGVSIYGPDNQFKSRVQWSSIFVEKRGNNSWLISGDTEA